MSENTETTENTESAPEANPAGAMLLREIDDETTVDGLVAGYRRSELNAAAVLLDLAPLDYRTKDDLAAAILKEYDEDLGSDDESPSDEEEALARDPRLADVTRWKVKTPIQYHDQRGRKSRGELGAVLSNIPTGIAQNLYKRGCLEPVLR